MHNRSEVNDSRTYLRRPPHPSPARRRRIEATEGQEPQIVGVPLFCGTRYYSFLSFSEELNMFSRILAAAGVLLVCFSAFGQENLTPNGIADQRAGAYAFRNANIYRADGSILGGGNLLVREGRIVEINDDDDVPAGYFPIDLAGKYVYPGLIDIYTDYGIPELERPRDVNGGGENLEPDDRARNVNDAIRADFRAAAAFVPDEDEREELRGRGFTVVLSLLPDGIARGTSALITLGDERASESVVVADAAAHYSLDKGTSIQAMPTSLMGSFALLRQTYMDAEWFGAREPRPFTDTTLEAWNGTQDLPQIMEVDNWQEALTVDGMGDDFGVQYVLKTSGDSYRRVEEIAATGAGLIVPLDFPEAPEVADPLDAEEVSFEALKHWELAPFNPRLLAERGIDFSLTSFGAGDDFWPNLRKAVGNGLPAQAAIAALTTVPAETLGVSDLIGRLAPGALANFLVTTGELLDEDTVLLESWIQGNRYVINPDRQENAGRYELALDGQTRVLEIEYDGADNSFNPRATLDPDGDSSAANIELLDDLITLDFAWDDDGDRVRLSGWSDAGGWRGNALTPAGESLSWRLSRIDDAAGEEAADEAAAVADLPSPVLYPFSAYGRAELPQARDFVVRGATVWTNEDEGTLVTDVHVRDGRIEAVGDGLDAGGAAEIDGGGKHLTPGIIDEHSHIALFNINETQTNSSMVRMNDVVDSESINIYRNAAGGGSCGAVAARFGQSHRRPVGHRQDALGRTGPGAADRGRRTVHQVRARRERQAQHQSRFGALSADAHGRRAGLRQRSLPSARIRPDLGRIQRSAGLAAAADRAAAARPRPRGHARRAERRVARHQPFLRAVRDQHAHARGRAVRFQHQHLHPHSRRLQSRRQDGPARRGRFDLFRLVGLQVGSALRDSLQRRADAASRRGRRDQLRRRRDVAPAQPGSRQGGQVRQCERSRRAEDGDAQSRHAAASRRPHGQHPGGQGRGSRALVRSPAVDLRRGGDDLDRRRALLRPGRGHGPARGDRRRAGSHHRLNHEPRRPGGMTNA